MIKKTIKVIYFSYKSMIIMQNIDEYEVVKKEKIKNQRRKKRRV